MKTKQIIIVALVLIITITGLAVKPQSTMAQTQELATANNRFGVDLFTQVWQQSDNQNIFIAPASVSFALAMLYNGAEGDTAREISEVLHTGSLSLAEVNSQNLNLRQRLQEADPKVTLAIANSVWMRQDFSFKPEFIENNRTFYDAEITELDFSSPTTVTTINEWVESNTSGKITEIIDSIDSQQVLFLINAVYFKSPWKHTFAEENTAERTFYLADGGEKSLPMMSQTNQFPYLQTETFQAISLPYGETENLSMEVFLPSQDSSLDEFITQLNLEKLNQWLSELNRTEINIVLPRFTLEYEVELKEILAQLGLNQAFNYSQANFSAMTDAQVYVDGVKHKTFVEVNEEGTEAAGVTSIGIRATSLPTTMEVNRPFFYVIREHQTDTILFMGAMLDPTA